jgi:alginate O-acetyltransferase complex protein AlgJ
MIRFCLLLSLFVPFGACQSAPDYRELFRQTAASAGGSFTVTGTDGWLFAASDFLHLASDPVAWTQPGADPVGVVADVAAQMKAAGVDFMVMPLPTKASVQTKGLPDSFKDVAITDPVLDAFLAAMAKQGVETLDVRTVWTNASSAAVFCRQDTHWNGHGLGLAAHALAEKIRSRPWFAGLPKKTYAAEPVEVEIQGDLWIPLNKPDLPKEKLKLRRAVALETPGADSPVLFIGDSNVLVFSGGGDLHTTGCGLPEAFALETGINPQVLGQRGSGHAQILNLKRGAKDAKFLPAKKLVVWVFTCTELTQAQAWKSYPLKFK